MAVPAPALSPSDSDPDRSGHVPGLNAWVRRATALAFTVTVTVIGAGCAGGEDPAVTASAADAVAANAIVERVVDGDTIDVVIDGTEERVRLTGIDTPEIAHEASGDRPAKEAECFADEAHAYARSLIDTGDSVRLERDVVGRDDYGRLLAYVYRSADGVFVNYELVRQGYATPLSIEPNTTYADLMVEAATAAERSDLGLWQACR
ncbi:MAG: hypothetical protein CL424_09385 [Acidimicrobiaceae bacterium]|nr:hypothetical protein [Acidimicrobiaceae bacterium]